MSRFTSCGFPFVRLSVVFASSAALTLTSAIAEEPKPVAVVNTPTVNAEHQGAWTVALQGPVILSSSTSIGIDPAQNAVRLPALQPMQESAPLLIDYPDRSWSWSVAIPAGKRLMIEYVSGSFTKRIGDTGEQTAPPFRFTVTTTAGGQTVSHVLPVSGVLTFAAVISYFQVAQHIRLYADGGTNVTVKLEHLFSGGYIGTRAR